MKELTKLEPVILQRNSAEIDRKISNNESFADNLNAILDLFKTEYEKIKYNLTPDELLKAISGQAFMENSTNGVTNASTFFSYVTEQEIKLQLQATGLNIVFAKAKELFAIDEPSRELVSLLTHAFQILGGGYHYNGVSVSCFEVDEKQKISFKESQRRSIINNHSTVLTDPKEILAYHKITSLLTQLSEEVRELNGNNGHIDLSLLFKTVTGNNGLTIELLQTAFPSFRNEYFTAMHAMRGSQPAPAKGMSAAQKELLVHGDKYPGVFI